MRHTFPFERVEATAQAAFMSVCIRHIFISSGHNYIGHHGEASGAHPTEEVAEIRCVAGRGLEGDRFFDFKSNYKGQITFFAWETYLAMRERHGVLDKGPGVFRRNVITEGLDLTQLIGAEFEIQGVRFVGTQEAAPCEWMNEAFCPGALESLQGVGGLRARILSDGILRATTSPQSSSSAKVPL